MTIHQSQKFANMIDCPVSSQVGLICLQETGPVSGDKFLTVEARYTWDHAFPIEIKKKKKERRKNKKYFVGANLFFN